VSIASLEGLILQRLHPKDADLIEEQPLRELALRFPERSPDAPELIAGQAWARTHVLISYKSY
jgi:hypothetical protein